MLKYEIKLEDLRIEQTCCRFSPGVTLYEVIAPGWLFPIATAYTQFFGSQHEKHIAILLKINVDESMRKCGVGKFLHKEIEKEADIIITNGSTKLGTFFIKAMGYVYDSMIDSYVWKKRKVKK